MNQAREVGDLIGQRLAALGLDRWEPGVSL